MGEIYGIILEGLTYFVDRGSCGRACASQVNVKNRESAVASCPLSRVSVLRGCRVQLSDLYTLRDRFMMPPENA